VALIRKSHFGAAEELDMDRDGEASGESHAMSTGRLESFSDGVIAVAATLLVLNVTVPIVGSHGSLGHALADNWHIYLAYAVSFITIGIIWINHHVVFSRLRIADHAILMLNLLLLLWIALIPFATSLMTEYLRQGHGQHLAAAVYAGMFLLMSISFATLNWFILFRRTALLRVELSFDERRTIMTRFVTGLIPYAAATALAAVSPYVTFAICAAVAVFYALPIAAGMPATSAS
jgi:TMEM175 potassium channel family protein